MLFIFDMGGVVSGNVHTIPKMAATLSITIEEFLLFSGIPSNIQREHTFDFGLLAEIQSGVINSSLFWEKFRANAKKSLENHIDVYKHIEILTNKENLWHTHFEPKPILGTIAIIQKLKDMGLRVVCGTNTLDAHFNIHKNAGDYAIFDHVYASHQMGSIKPNHEFWMHILKEEQRLPKNTWFIDDNAPNIRASLKLGIYSHLFTNPKKLAQDLSTRLAVSFNIDV